MSPAASKSAGKPAAKAAASFDAVEKTAMKARAQELKAQARADRTRQDGEREVLAAIARMAGPDRAMAERVHALVKAHAPALVPRTWYGMPAYAVGDKVLCFFKDAQKFKDRYATLGFNDSARLDDGAIWPTAFALKAIDATVERRIATLLKKAVGRNAASDYDPGFAIDRGRAMRKIVPGSCCALFGIAMALCAPSGIAADAPPTARVADGMLSGIHDAKAGLDEFKGIPYAAPPVGALRWKPPQPAAAWQGVRKADHFAARCMQRPLYGDMVFRSAGMSEDCLYLNVWTPAHREKGKLPVLVYFYGGSMLAGDGSEPRYDGASLAQRGIVTVTVNYRLDVFGLLALPQLAAESPHHATGDYSELDMAAALRWVHANIAAFGGNPDEVTIGGESAGSMAVSALMASPLSKHLMQRAIGESGAMLGNLTPMPLAEAEARSEAFLQATGAHSLEQLRALPTATLMATLEKLHGNSDSGGIGTTIDGWFLPRSPEAIYAAGEQAHIPLLAGSNSQEGSWQYLLAGKPPTPANYRAALQRMFGAHAAEALRLYPGRDEAEVKASGTALASDQFIAFATGRWALQQQHSGAPVYYYHFEQPRPAKRDGSAKAGTGAVHSGEIEYALGNLDGNKVYAWTATDHRVSRVMEGYWANFIKTGNPNGPGLPHWSALADKDGGVLRQAIGADTHGYVDRMAVPRYDFLERVEPDAHL